MQTARGYALKRLCESNPRDAHVVGALHKASAQGREFTVINSADFANFGLGDQADNIFERKNGEANRAKAPNISIAASGAPMPGPDDFEPDDEQGEFDPSKEGNHNKVRRDGL